MKYREVDYKYILTEPISERVAIYPLCKIVTEDVILTEEGVLLINEGFGYDGPSGLTIDDKSNLRGAAVHDALCRLMRLRLLSTRWRKAADKELKRIMIATTRNRGWFGRTWGWIRAQYYYAGVRLFGWLYVRPQKVKILEAP